MSIKKFGSAGFTGGFTEKTGESPAGVSHYWTMQPPTRVQFSEGAGGSELAGGHGPAPDLAPITSTDTSKSGAIDGPSTHVNIRDNHHWTESPRSSRREVPMLNMKEMNMVTNPMLNQIANNTFAFGGGVGQAKNALDGAVGGAGQFVDVIKGAWNSVTDLTKKENVKQTEVEKAFSRAGSNENQLRGAQKTLDFVDPMNPYGILYTTLNTGFKYTFPFMENNYMSHINSFGDATMEYSAGGFQEGTALLMSGMNKLFSSLNLDKAISPGRMIEQPKAFTFTGREKSYTVKFPLFNTLSYADIVRNWQFLFLLSYQNSPNRINRDMIDPPCIYESVIPGVWYSKYSAITDMTVDFVGARREMGVEIKHIDVYSGGDTTQAISKEVITVIPDAYQVSITVTELFAETQNFKYRMLAESMQDRVTTGSVDSDSVGVFTNLTRPS